MRVQRRAAFEGVQPQMSELRRRAIEQYARHYARVNPGGIDPNHTKAKRSAGLSLTYGSLVETLPPGSRVLDLGCGTGFLLRWLSTYPNLTIQGVDSSPSQVEVASGSLPDVAITCEDGLEHLRKHESSFAGIFCFDVIEHLPDEDTCLDWMVAARSALVPSGFLCCRSPNAANLTGNYSRYMDITHARVFTDTSLVQLLEASGMRRCRAVPVRVHGLIGATRLLVENSVHRLLFLLCGRGKPTVHTHNVSVVGYRSDSVEDGLRDQARA